MRILISATGGSIRALPDQSVPGIIGLAIQAILAIMGTFGFMKNNRD